MKNISSTLQFFLHLAKINAVASRRFDAGLGGLGFSDFLILFHLLNARDEKLRRTDLAEKIGLTASGVTRLLAPMEKVGLIQREATTEDARVSYVVLAPGGKRKLQESLENAEDLATELITFIQKKDLRDAAEIIEKLSISIK